MLSIYDFNPTKEELRKLFHPRLVNRSKRDYLDGMSQEDLYVDIAFLFWIRGEGDVAESYISRTSPSRRTDFYNLIGGF